MNISWQQTQLPAPSECSPSALVHIPAGQCTHQAPLGRNWARSARLGMWCLQEGTVGGSTGQFMCSHPWFQSFLPCTKSTWTTPNTTSKGIQNHSVWQSGDGDMSNGFGSFPQCQAGLPKVIDWDPQVNPGLSQGARLHHRLWSLWSLEAQQLFSTPKKLQHLDYPRDMNISRPLT